MELGAFSISLAVKDIQASKSCYEKLGFQAFGGDIDQNWLILKNGPHVNGLFQGMFHRNMLTFNPGWDQDAQKLEAFTDVRELQCRMYEVMAAYWPTADQDPSPLTWLPPASSTNTAFTTFRSSWALARRPSRT